MNTKISELSLEGLAVIAKALTDEQLEVFVIEYDARPFRNQSKLEAGLKQGHQLQELKKMYLAMGG